MLVYIFALYWYYLHPKLHYWCTYSRLAEAEAELCQKDQKLQDKEEKLNAKDQELQEKERLLKTANEEREAATQQWGRAHAKLIAMHLCALCVCMIQSSTIDVLTPD